MRNRRNREAGCAPCTSSSLNSYSVPLADILPYAVQRDNKSTGM